MGGFLNVRDLLGYDTVLISKRGDRAGRELAGGGRITDCECAMTVRKLARMSGADDAEEE